VDDELLAEIDFFWFIFMG